MEKSAVTSAFVMSKAVSEETTSSKTPSIIGAVSLSGELIGNGMG